MSRVKRRFARSRNGGDAVREKARRRGRLFGALPTRLAALTSIKQLLEPRFAGRARLWECYNCLKVDAGWVGNE